MAKSQQWNTLLPSVIKYMAKPSSAVPQFTEVQINKPSYFKIRLFTAKEKIARKGVDYVICRLDQFKNLSKYLEALIFDKNSNS